VDNPKEIVGRSCLSFSEEEKKKGKKQNKKRSLPENSCRNEKNYSVKSIKKFKGHQSTQGGKRRQSQSS